MRARNPLYIMVKPPPEAQALITTLPRNDPDREAALLHVTLVSLFDLHYAQPEWLAQVIAALDSFEGQAFPLAFDRIENRKAVTLRTRAPLAEARGFQQGLVRHLLLHKAPMMLGTTPEPHVTINYHGDRQGSQKIAPIGWTVAEIRLIESVVGKTTHIEHGRWPLAAKEPRMTRQSLAHIALVVRDYDEALAFYVGTLGFELVEDTYQPEQDKRWVTIRPPGAAPAATTILLARASTPEQERFIGDQAGGRVFLFLQTDDFQRDYTAMLAKGVTFVRPPAEQPYGTVAVFADLYGNRWDLIQFTAA